LRRQQTSDGKEVVDLWLKNTLSEGYKAQASSRWATGKSSKWKPAEDNDLDDGSQITSKTRSYSVMVYWYGKPNSSFMAEQSYAGDNAFRLQ
tara:strand:- start:1510 stop:1785 length:276 start_codon:yes stop_codon:yes gene_type:complete